MTKHKHFMDEGKRGPKVDRTQSERERFLGYCIENEITVTVFIANGQTFEGIPRSHDKRWLLLGYRNPNKVPLMIQTQDIQMVRAKEILHLRKEYETSETAIRKARRKALERRVRRAIRLGRDQR